MSDKKAVELSNRLTALAVEYVQGGESIEDVVSCVFGWAVGTSMREFEWGPEDIGRHVQTLVEQIAEAHRVGKH